ncbi:rac GTPase-activating protein 1 [Electrophorus electricus]|uniref:rac GTPase-activating protein 1 n=1 Tax=Electrophorus electricus TaxID=8005 RepID=UPI0015D00873|nr:rac GTPase-activating protein 1 [Electrophorus electricus]
MGEAFVREVLSLCLQTIALDQNFELEFIEVVRNFEVVRKKWLYVELELKRYKELLVQSDVARAALEVKLKHARNQVDVEIKKRCRVEADYQYLERQILRISDILVHDGQSSACLNEEQRSVLANFRHRGAMVSQHKSRRLSVIDESSFLSHSDISYDRTEDDLDLESTATLKPLKSRAREKRRSSMGPNVGSAVQKRGRLSGRSGDLLPVRHTEKEMEGTVVTASVTTPDSGSQIHMVIDITQETVEQARGDQGTPLHSQGDLSLQKPQCLDSACHAELTSVWASSEVTEAEIVPEMEETVVETARPPDNTPMVEKSLQHVFLPKTVIRPETCVPCGKRIRFGKVVVKCRDCRVIAHPECKHLCLERCSPIAHGTPHPNEDTLESFAPFTQPRVPTLIIQCVHEIERRGLQERGVYRVPGGERQVKELRERYVSGRGPLMLHKVDEVHVVCGLLKDFLRKLKEPLVTFKLHRSFMEAAESTDDDRGVAELKRAVTELPRANRDTLAFLVLHLQRVMNSPPCQMDQNNLARVFGPTIVGHAMPEPSPLTIMKDTNTQPKVVLRLLSLPPDYWKSLLQMERDQVISSVVNDKIGSAAPGSERDRIFKPVTSPELSKYPSKYPNTPGSASLKGKIKNLGSAFNNPIKPRNEPGKKFFTSPK